MKLSKLWLKICRKFLLSKAQRGELAWSEISPHNALLRLCSEELRNSLVIDVGAFEGDYIEFALSCAASKVHAFEIEPSFRKDLTDRYELDDRVQVHSHGLAEKNSVVYGENRGNSTTVEGAVQIDACKGLGTLVKFELKRATESIDALDLEAFVVMKMNIEGSEYPVLLDLARTGVVSKIDVIYVQFHRKPSGWFNSYEKVQIELAKTHRCVFRVYMVWEKWVAI